MKSLFTTALILLACTLSTMSFAYPNPQAPPTVEILRGLIANHKGFTVQVDSNGCTNKESFEILILESHPAQIQFLRKGEDMCRVHQPYGTKLTYTYAELGLTTPHSFSIINKINTGLLPKYR